MSDSFELKLNMPLTKEDWDILTDVELEHTTKITYTTPSGKRVEFVPVAREKGQWIVDTDASRSWDRARFYCSKCRDWQTYGETRFCPNCGSPMEVSE